MNKNKKITIKDIARLAGTTAGTVDRVLHNRAEVSEATRQKILKVIKEIGYEPNIVARSLANKKKFNIAILIPKPTKANPYWQMPMNGMERAASEIQHFGFIFHYFLYDFLAKNSFQEECSKILNAEFDAVIMAPFFKKETELFALKLETKQTPYIYIESKLQNTNYLGFIGQDAFQSGFLAGQMMNYLITLNASVLIVNITKEFDNSNTLIERTSGFKSFFSEKILNNEVTILQLDIPDSNDPQNIILENLLLSEKNIQGIFIPNSRAFLIANHIIKQNLKGIHLIGYDAITKNIEYLKQGFIDFLIGQRSEEQSYKAVISIFNHFLLKKEIQRDIFMPIDIITSENVDFYVNYK